MKERIKTIILLFLIGLSLFLTNKIWFKGPIEALDIVKNVNKSKEVKEDKYPMINLISPSKYLLNFGLDKKTMIYDDNSYGIWKESQNLLKKLFSSNNIEITEINNNEYDEYKKRKSVIFHFPEKINSYILAKSLDVKKPNEVVELVPKLDRIYLHIGGEDSFFIFSKKGKHKKIVMENMSKKDILELREIIDKASKKNFPYYYSMRDTLGTDNDVYIPYEINYNILDIYVENKVPYLNDMEKIELAESFLGKNIDYIREIVEDNKSTIYLYEQESLKINTNGTIEYFNPISENINERNLYQSLKTASEFISNRVNLQKGMYLSEVEEIEYENSLGYRLNFNYRVKGVPVILGSQEMNDHIQMEVFNNHVRSYKYFDRKDMNKVESKDQEISDKMLSAFDAIDLNSKLLSEWYIDNYGIDEDISKDQLVQGVLSLVKEINLGYFDPCLKDKEEKLVPVWIIRFDNKIFGFNIYSGSLVFNKKI